MINGEVAYCVDAGRLYSVIRTDSYINTIVEPGIYIVKCSYSAIEKIKEILESGDNVYIPKNLIHREIMPGDLILEDTDALSKAKKIALIELDKQIGSLSTSLSFYDLFGYLSEYAYWATKGIFIHDLPSPVVVDALEKMNLPVTSTGEDRDEAYYRIIERENDEELQRLQDFLVKLERIKKAHDRYTELQEARSIIENATSVEEIKEYTGSRQS